MVTIEELKLGNRTLEALKFLLEQTTELETVISQINISEIKDANTLTKEQIATLQDVKNAVETINSDLSLKKSDFDEKKADFDSKNNTALSNFAFIANNVEKINKTSDLLAEAKAILEQIKPIEQRAKTALETLANSQSKFTELEALKATLLELKRSLENINTTGLINDNTISETTTYSSQKVEGLVSNAKITLAADIKSKTDSLTTIINNQKQSITTLDSKINSTQDNLNSLASSVSGALEQKADKTTFNTFVAKTTDDLNLKANKNDLPSVAYLEATFLKKTDKIDAYTKEESDEKFALKDDLPPLATETKVGITKLKNIINAKQTDAAVTEKAVSDAIEAMKNSIAGTAKLSSNGYIKLPSGLILQWMRATSGGTQLFPITFPNECFFVSATHTALQGSTEAVGLVSTRSFNNSRATFWSSQSGSGAMISGQCLLIFAIGW